MIKTQYLELDERYNKKTADELISSVHAAVCHLATKLFYCLPFPQFPSHFEFKKHTIKRLSY
jgi:hypothetical protein